MIRHHHKFYNIYILEESSMPKQKVRNYHFPFICNDTLTFIYKWYRNLTPIQNKIYFELHTSTKVKSKISLSRILQCCYINPWCVFIIVLNYPSPRLTIPSLYLSTMTAWILKQDVQIFLKKRSILHTNVFLDLITVERIC